MLKASEYKQDKKIVRYIALNLFAFFVSIYLLSASGHNYFNNETGELRIQVAKSIVEKSDLSIQKDVAVKGADGRYYSWIGIGAALLAVPFYIAGDLIGDPGIAVSIMNQIAGAATVVLIFLFSNTLGYSRRASLLVAIFYGVGTMAWPLSKQPFDHAIETYFILLSIYCMYLYSIDKKVSRLLYSATSIGFAFITRPTSILVIPPLFILMSISLSKEADFKTILKLMIRNISLFSLALLPFISLFLWYNYYRFGSIFETGYQLIAERTGFDNFTNTSFLAGLRGLLISPGKGFFYYSPVAILFFFSIKSFIKKHFGLGASFIFIMISYLLFFSKLAYWHGDWAWGPRYIFVLTPFFIIPLAELFSSNIWNKKKFPKAIIYFLLALSLVIQIAAVSVDFQKYFLDLRFIEKEHFTIVQGSGVQPAVLPPDETYHDWKKSPMVAQFVSVYTIAREIKSYKYVDVELEEGASIEEQMKTSPYMNLYDFWWLYNYYETRSYSWFFMALIFIIIALYAATRLWKVSVNIN